MHLKYTEEPAGHSPCRFFTFARPQLSNTVNSTSPTRDPHHGDHADEEFHPWVSASDLRIDQQIAERLRKFAWAYNGEWRWTFGSGQNCHTIQEGAMRVCKLRMHPPTRWFLTVIDALSLR